MRAPASSAMRGLHTPHAITTVSVTITPASVSTARTRPSSTRMPVTSVFGDTVSAPRSFARPRNNAPASTGSTTPPEGVQKPARTRLVSTNGTNSPTRAASTNSASTP